MTTTNTPSGFQMSAETASKLHEALQRAFAGGDARMETSTGALRYDHEHPELWRPVVTVKLNDEPPIDIVPVGVTFPRHEEAGNAATAWAQLWVGMLEGLGLMESSAPWEFNPNPVETRF